MNITASELKQRLSDESCVSIIDVREELEYYTFNIGGENIPLGKLPSIIDELDYGRSEEIVIVCQRGLRSMTACKLLIAAGFMNVRNLDGGLLAYKRISSS